MVACDENIVFSEPHPVKGKPLTEFPKQYTGIYVNDDSTEYIEITNQKVYSFNGLSEIMANNELPDNIASNLPALGDTAVFEDEDEIITIVSLGDSVWMNVAFCYFDISDSDVLKKMGKDYYLNFETDSSMWQIIRVVFDKNKLSYYYTGEQAARVYYNDTSDSKLIIPPMKNKAFKQFWETTQDFQGEWVKVE